MSLYGKCLKSLLYQGGYIMAKSKIVFDTTEVVAEVEIILGDVGEPKKKEN